MRVSSVMSKQVDYVKPDTTVEEVSRIIFGRGVTGVPVCEDGRQIVGFITEKDILSRFYPTIKEYVDDTTHASDFESMEKKIPEILCLTAKDIMNKNPITVTPDTPLLKAHSIMNVENVGRLPVVNDRGKLVGILSRGDIFRAAVGDKLTFYSDEEYHDWLSKHYDLIINWVQRLGNEVPNLTTLFIREGVESVIDIGFGTGEHDIALVQEGFNILGIESSKFMANTAIAKLNKLPKDVAQRVSFQSGNYEEILKSQGTKYDAAIFMGNAYPHMLDYEKVLKTVSATLEPKKALIVMQIVNFNKLWNVTNRFQALTFTKSKLGDGYEHAFLEFYDPPRKKAQNLTLTMTVLDYDGKKWLHRATNSTPIVNLDQDDIRRLLKKNGFKDITFYGGMYSGPLFRHPFDPFSSDWLNVIAKR